MDRRLPPLPAHIMILIWIHDMFENVMATFFMAFLFLGLPGFAIFLMYSLVSDTMKNNATCERMGGVVMHGHCVSKSVLIDIFDSKKR